MQGNHSIIEPHVLSFMSLLNPHRNPEGLLVTSPVPGVLSTLPELVVGSISS